MRGPEPLSKDLIELIESLTSHGVEFLVAGAHVLAHHGRGRFTEDLDFFLRRTDDNVVLVRDALHEFGFDLSEEAQSRLRDDTRGFIALGRKPNRVDLLNFLDGVDFDEAWRRKSPGQLAGIDVFFLSLEDYVATKRSSGRPKDRLDLELLRDAVGPLPDDVP